ncbi:hypothetical protein OS493_032147 [Desmophyllum pertusum]|uniref:Uncharacterized protein n=1 Tax=Desmophyllum pertusum TaxID=174260 RepID=A0A9X0CCM5_9CNID|nr:hypothetical protein OS493_032147 [Desmophyllum pertusum]
MAKKMKLNLKPQEEGIELTNDEEKALCLPPKFAVYDRVDLTSCEAQIEKGLAKLRWSIIRRADSGPDEGEGEKERTDKSGRFAVDTLGNYRVACQPQVENDPTVTEELHEKAQAEANAHSVLWVRILNAGEGVGGQARIKSNMLVSNYTLAPLYALRKDHKNTVDHNIGPPVRPVCGAVSAYNKKLSHLMSFILAEVWKEEESVCLNTEEIHISEDIIVGSADVKALYPSLDIPFTVEKVCEVFHTSGVQVVGINAEELGLYLALNRTETELTDVGLLQFCPQRKTRRGRPPTITGCALDENKTKRFKPWLPPAEEPDENTTRKMFTEAMKIVLLFIMKNHYYTFDNQGLELTGRVAENGLKVWVYKRYVDDIDVIMNAPNSGLRFVESECKVVQDENIAELERDLKADKRCMLLVQSIGNSIHPSIELEVDYPSQHGDGKLPILDLKVWVGREEKKRDWEWTRA